MNQSLSESDNQFIQRFDTPIIRDFDFPVESGNQPMPYAQAEPAAIPDESAAKYEGPAAGSVPAAEPDINEIPVPLVNPVVEPAAPVSHLNPEIIPKFVDGLTKPPVYSPVSCGDEEYLYVVDISQFKQQLLPEGFPETTVWGYGGSVMDEETRQHRYFKGVPGATFEAVRNMPVEIRWINNLGTPQLMSADPALGWPKQDGFPDSAGPVPVVTHLHGANIPLEYNGHPDAWFSSTGEAGPAYRTSCYSYPNSQDASALWYRDNAPGIGRLSVYAGLAGFYLLRSGEEFGWRWAGNLPGSLYEIPLIIQDRSFNTDGSLSFTGIGSSAAAGPDWATGFFGDTITVNGKTWPNLNVERRQYRFRVLNGSAARVYNLRLSNGMQLTKIGASDGFLPEPVVLDTLLLAPDERADILIDFSRIPPGTKIVLTNDAKAPYPNGSAPDPETTGQILQFTVPANPPPPVNPKKLPQKLCL